MESNFNIVETLNKHQKSWHEQIWYIHFYFQSVFQVIANTLLLLSANLIGYYYQFMSSKSQKRTFEQIRSTVESRVKLECEKEHQEQLLLSVIPAYIAAEVCTLSQGPLITDGRNSCKWTGPTVGLSKSFIRVKISGQNYWKLVSNALIR